MSRIFICAIIILPYNVCAQNVLDKVLYYFHNFLPMNKTKKLVAGLTLLVLSSSVSSVFAEDLTTTSSSWANSKFSERKAEMKAKMEEKKEAFKQLKKERKEFVWNKREEMKQNREEFRNTHAEEFKTTFKSIDDEVKTKLKESRNSFKSERQEIIAKLKDKTISFEEKSELLKDLHEVNKNAYETLKDNLSWNEQALGLLEKRKEVYDVNSSIRSDISEKRKEFREKRSEVISKYKTLVIKKIGSKIDRMSDEQLEKLKERVEALYTKIENNDKMTEERKEKTLSLLEWLIDTINEKLEMIVVEEDNEVDIIDEVLDLEE